MTLPPLPINVAELHQYGRLWDESSVKQYAAAVRSAALEEAAKVCEELAVKMDSMSSMFDYEQDFAESHASRVAMSRLDQAAAAIRALE